uniref:Uncharacterized protein n=1 Tax=Rhizophora mucronata TaxID=61149 RepID=A0A2P2JCE4_RHIMU
MLISFGVNLAGLVLQHSSVASILQLTSIFSTEISDA